MEKADQVEEWWKDYNLFAQWCLETPSVDLGPFSKAGQVTGPVRPNGKGRLMAGEGDAEQEPEQAAEDEGFAARALPAPPQPTPEMLASHNVSHIPFRSWCAHCVRGRGKSFYHRKVSHEADRFT